MSGSSVNQQLRFVDLFCGLGVFHMAFRKHDGTCVFACDIDDRVRKIYELNHKIKPSSDINKVNISDIPDHDVLCAGFPCQPFSIAGNKEGFADDVKGNLFFKILEIVDEKNPKAIILENVKNILTIDNGNAIRTILQTLEERNYKTHYKVLNSVFYGSPQCRERLFIIAIKNGITERLFEFPEGNKNEIKQVKEILDEDTNKKLRPSLEKYDMVKVEERNIAHKPKMLYKLINKETQKGGRQGERIYDTNHPGPTVCASSGGPGSKTGLYKVGNEIRKLSVQETLKMFGFPNDYKYDNLDCNKMLFYLGNSIVVNVAQAVVDRLCRTLVEQNA